MCFEDFLSHYTSINIAEVKPWEEIRLKGKFIRVKEVDNEELGTSDQDWVISKFYYTFTVQEACNICITVHQEDPRIEGADKRPLLDIGFVVFQTDQNGNMFIYSIPETIKNREVQDEVWYEAGTYTVVPFTSGGLLQRPFVPANLTDWSTVSLQDRFDYLDYHTTFQDIFRKIDLSFNRVLDEFELE